MSELNFDIIYVEVITIDPVIEVEEEKIEIEVGPIIYLGKAMITEIDGGEW